MVGSTNLLEKKSIDFFYLDEVIKAGETKHRILEEVKVLRNILGADQ